MRKKHRYVRRNMVFPHFRPWNMDFQYSGPLGPEAATYVKGKKRFFSTKSSFWTKVTTTQPYESESWNPFGLKLMRCFACRLPPQIFSKMTKIGFKIPPILVDKFLKAVFNVYRNRSFFRNTPISCPHRNWGRFPFNKIKIIKSSRDCESFSQFRPHPRISIDF